MKIRAHMYIYICVSICICGRKVYLLFFSSENNSIRLRVTVEDSRANGTSWGLTSLGEENEALGSQCSGFLGPRA